MEQQIKPGWPIPEGSVDLDDWIKMTIGIADVPEVAFAAVLDGIESMSMN